MLLSFSPMHNAILTPSEWCAKSEIDVEGAGSEDGGRKKRPRAASCVEARRPPNATFWRIKVDVTPPMYMPTAKGCHTHYQNSCGTPGERKLGTTQVCNAVRGEREPETKQNYDAVRGEGPKPKPIAEVVQSGVAHFAMQGRQNVWGVGNPLFSEVQFVCTGSSTSETLHQQIVHFSSSSAAGTRVEAALPAAEKCRAVGSRPDAAAAAVVAAIATASSAKRKAEKTSTLPRGIAAKGRGGWDSCHELTGGGCLAVPGLYRRGRQRKVREVAPATADPK